MRFTPNPRLANLSFLSTMPAWYECALSWRKLVK